MENLVFAPIILALLLGTLTQLVDLGEQASNKAIDYSEDAVAAIDCAFQARALTECSPDITSTDFKEEIEESQRLLDELDEQFKLAKTN